MCVCLCCECRYLSGLGSLIPLELELLADLDTENRTGTLAGALSLHLQDQSVLNGSASSTEFNLVACSMLKD